uniref:Uncharacterized protein n=1 Tax=Fagus sylvatica TaxID=28930 RepID=A0A2N9ESY1_FAGSY
MAARRTLTTVPNRNPPSHRLPFVPFGSDSFLSSPFQSCSGGLRRSPEVVRDSWRGISFLTARSSLAVGGMIFSGCGCSEDNGFGVIFHIKPLSSTLI